MIVTVPARENHDGFHATTVEILDQCPMCGGPRDEVFDTVIYDGSRRLHCDGWDNPCGHVDKYRQARVEADAVKYWKGENPGRSDLPPASEIFVLETEA